MSAARQPPVSVSGASDFAKRLMQPHTPERFRWLFDRSLPVDDPESAIQQWLGKQIQLVVVNPRIRELVALIDQLAAANRMPLLMHTDKTKTLAEYVLHRIVADVATQPDQSTDGRTGSLPDKDTYVRYLKTITAEFPVRSSDLTPDNSIGVALRKLVDAAASRSIERSLAVCKRFNFDPTTWVGEVSRSIWLKMMLRRARKPFADGDAVLTAIRSVCDRVNTTAKRRRWQRLFRRSGHPLEMECSGKFGGLGDKRAAVIVEYILADTKWPIDAALNPSMIESDIERFLGTRMTVTEQNRLNQKLDRRIRTYLDLPSAVR